VIEVRTRRRNQPHRDPARPWLQLRPDEVWPQVVQADPPALVVWSSLWSVRPDAVIRFDLPPDASSGTDLRWTLLVCEPVPDDDVIESMRYRLNQLINANLRYTFGE
jgi:hypothetical protein